MRSAIVLIALCAACAAPPSQTPDVAADGEGDLAYVRDFEPDPGAHLLGDIGAVREIDDDASYFIDEWEHGDRLYQYAELDAFGDNGRWAMLGVTFLGGMEHPDLAGGDTLTFERAEWAPDQDVQPEGFAVAVVGCSDPDVSDDVSMFDEEAVFVELTRRDASEPFVEVTAHFADGQTVLGSYPIR
jgi:hypothetical protein